LAGAIFDMLDSWSAQASMPMNRSGISADVIDDNSLIRGETQQGTLSTKEGA